MTRSFKAVLLESLLDHDGFRQALSVDELAEHARTVFQRRRRFIPDLRTDLQDLDDAKAGQLLRYWRANPINAWTWGNRSGQSRAWFEIREGCFCPTFDVAGEDLDTFQSMVRELVDYRFAAYEPRLTSVGADCTESGRYAQQTSGCHRASRRRRRSLPVAACHQDGGRPLSTQGRSPGLSGDRGGRGDAAIG